MKLAQNKYLIKSLLEEKEIYRNDHEQLIYAVWHTILMRDGKDIESMPARELMNMFVRKELPKPASIMRTRRAIQQEIPRLRGVSHKIRQDKQEEVKKELKELRFNL